MAAIIIYNYRPTDLDRANEFAAEGKHQDLYGDMEEAIRLYTLASHHYLLYLNERRENVDFQVSSTCRKIKEKMEKNQRRGDFLKKCLDAQKKTICICSIL